MSKFKNIRTGLDYTLSQMSGGTPISWYNLNYIPVLGTMYLRPTQMPGKSVHLEITDGTQNNPGIYQIDVFGALNKGVGPVLDKIDQLSDYFKAFGNITSGNNIIYIQSISTTPMTVLDNTWIKSGIQINYTCYSV